MKDEKYKDKSAGRSEKLKGKSSDSSFILHPSSFPFIPHPSSFLLLGLCMAAVLLAKATGIVIVGVVLLVLIGRTIALPRSTWRPYLGGLGVATAMALLLSGWHYGRVAARFGTPLVANFDAASGNLYWQDPGIGTFTYLFSFGRALTTPFYSGLTSLPDGIYATLWGDGLCGGMAFWKDRLPWNYDLMAAGYLLALAPSLMIVVGFVAAFWQMMKQPRAEWFLLVGVIAGLTVATVYQFLRYPYSSHAKSIYLLTGMTTLCALGAWGGDLLARTGRIGSILAVTLLGAWGLTAYASFWIQPESAATQNWIGLRDVVNNRPGDALKRFQRAVEIDSHFNQARLNEVGLLAKSGPGPRVRKLLDEVLKNDPDNPEGLILMGLLLQAEGKDDQALDFLNKASRLAPDNPLVQPVVGRILMKNGRNTEAILAFRKGLRISPESTPGDQANLGILLAQEGQTEEAIARYRQALLILPDYPYWQADLAWLLSTREDPRFHDPKEALQLAQAACAGQGAEDPACLEALAASQAAAGEFDEALKTAERGIQVATTGNQAKIVRRLEAATRMYRESKEFRTDEPLHERPYYTLMPPPIAE
jgi:tetratricopeptide (TPR) repeat protein